jgi:N-acyl-D-amino-acid deacylase
VDVVIRGGAVVDGTGNPWYRGDVLIAGDRILDVVPTGGGDDPVPGGAEVVDASGMVVAPGFIDIQSHSIRPLMVDGRCLSKIVQGVTTEIMGEAWTPGPVGGGIEKALGDPTPGSYLALVPEWLERSREWRRFGDWLEALEASGVSPNIGSFLGGGTLRQFVRGMEMGDSGADELARMRTAMDDAMDDGAFGVAYALIYPPDAYVSTDEIVEVCRVVARRGGVYITHMRSEGDRFLEGVDEALEIGRRSGAPVEIYHLKAAGARNWPKMAQAIERIEAARAGGLDVTADMYPYTGAGTGLTSVLPPWIAEGGRLYERLRDPDVRARLRSEVLQPDGEWEALADLAGVDGVMPIGFEKAHNRRWNGRRLSEIAAERGQDWIDAVFDLLVDEGQRIATVYFLMEEANLRAQLRAPWVKISTDAGGVDPAWAESLGPAHPRSYGTYPRVLGRYVREQGVIGLEDAVRKMTSSVAARLGLRDRGLLRAGLAADVVVFDPATIGDRATFDAPHQLATGVRDVWVNGQRVLDGGAHTDARPGRRLGPATAV